MQKLTRIIAASLMLLVASQGQAGTIYTSEAAFNTAVAGLTNVWSEDFEGFPIGPALDPITIGGGAAEIVDSGFPLIVPVVSQVWIQDTGSTDMATIQGLGDSDLLLDAISFDFANELAGSWEFHHSGGTDTSLVFGPGLATDIKFLGWIGSGGESLSSTNFTATDGTLVDNINAYAGVPGPTSLLVLLGGLTLLAGLRRK